MSQPAKVPFKKMDEYCRTRYGRGLLEVDSTAAMWVAEHFGGFPNWTTISRKRNKIGLYMFSPTFQSPCWA